MADSKIPDRIGNFFAIVLDVSDLDRSVDFWLQSSAAKNSSLILPTPEWEIIPDHRRCSFKKSSR